MRTIQCIVAIAATANSTLLDDGEQRISVYVKVAFESILLSVVESAYIASRIESSVKLGKVEISQSSCNTCRMI